MVLARVNAKAKITEAKFLEEAMKMVLKKRNKLVNRLKLNSLVHGGADAITSFVTRLKPQARIGKFKEKCEACREAADYTDQIVLDNPTRDLANDDIKKKVLAMPEENRVKKLEKFQVICLDSCLDYLAPIFTILSHYSSKLLFREGMGAHIDSWN